MNVSSRKLFVSIATITISCKLFESEACKPHKFANTILSMCSLHVQEPEVAVPFVFQHLYKLSTGNMHQCVWPCYMILRLDLAYLVKNLPLPPCHPGPDYQVQVLLGTAPYTTHVQTCSDDPSRSKQTLTKTVKRGEETGETIHLLLLDDLTSTYKMKTSFIQW